MHVLGILILVKERRNFNIVFVYRSHVLNHVTLRYKNVYFKFKHQTKKNKKKQQNILVD